MRQKEISRRSFIKSYAIAGTSLILTEGISSPVFSNPVKLKPVTHIVFLITEDELNYEAHKTIPVFAAFLRKEYGYKVSVLLGSGPRGAYTYPNLELLNDAGLLVVFARRIALPHQQMRILKTYIKSGKPVVGIRTANHAFTAMDKIADGFEDWPGFVEEVLGCKNRGYGPVEPGTEVSVAPGTGDHPILKGLRTPQWHSQGNVYLVAPLLDEKAAILLIGKVNEITQPIAWTRMAEQSRVFYTSLGYPADFEMPQFITLLTNGIKWALGS